MAGMVSVTADAVGRYTSFTASLAGLQVPAGSSFNFVVGSQVDEARNIAVRRLLEDPAVEWLWFIDDDHTFDADILLRLLAHDVDIAVPYVLKKRPPFSSVLYAGIGDDGQFIPAQVPVEEQLVEVYAAGTAGMLIKRHVFEALADPWFEFMRVDGGNIIGEDLLFCAKAQDAGFGVFCDTSVRMGHITPMAVLPVVRDGQWSFVVENA